MQVSASVSPAAVAGELARLWRRLALGGESAAFAEIGELGLSLTQVKALWLLETTEQPIAVGDVAAHLGLSLPAASRTVDGLLRKGWVERREDEHDRRVRRVTLTASGRAIAGRITEARMQGLEAFAASLDDEQRARLHDALKEID